MPEIKLEGCTPEPLMSYLKALGVFRLVAEQADSGARLSWRSGVAHLDSKLDRDGLTRFFLEDYCPSPIVGPWGARSGFYPGSSESSAREALNTIIGAAHSQTRLTAFRDMIMDVRDLLARNNYSEKVRDEDKLKLMQICRNELTDEMLKWLDTVFILTDESRKFPPLLGTGGNEGSGSYVSTFAQVVVSLLVERENDGGVATMLFGDFTSSIGGLAVGHFNPGAIGGANSSQGFDGGGGVNSWDYLIAIEGTLFFAGAAARKYGTDTVSRAGYPFCVEAVAVGYATECDKEAGSATRAELWVPLWSSPTSLEELLHLFAEGRAQLGRRQARNAVEFALALSTLGVGRGISSFVRYAFVMRNGLSYFASPLGRLDVKHRPEARLLEDPPLVDWIDRLRRACSDKEKTPARYQSALRNIDRAMLSFATRSESGNNAKYLLDVLTALGKAEQVLASGLRFCKDKYIRPLCGLSSQWLEQADDKSSEFRLAVAVAGIQRESDKVGPFREFLEEVEVTKFVNWSPGSTSAVWSNQSLAANLAAVFRRRAMNAFREGLSRVPLYSTRPAALSDVLTFLNQDTDDDKLAGRILALSAVDWSKIQFRLPEKTNSDQVHLPFEFGVPRLLVQPLPLVAQGTYWNFGITSEPTTPDPDVFHMIASRQKNAVELGVDRAAQRLKSGGRLVNGYRNRRQSGRSLNLQSPINPERLLAAMLFPLSNHDLELIANIVLFPPESED